MAEQFLRRWHVLAAIPRAPVAIDVDTLRTALRGVGIEASLRSLRSDLTALAKDFPLRKDARGEGELWSWASDAPSWEVPAMDAPSAMVLSVVFAQAKAVLPKGVLGLLAPAAARTRDVLGGEPARLRVLPWGPPLGPPDVEPAVLVPVLIGLREGRALDLVVARPENPEPVRLKGHPYGLVVREGRLYLVAGVPEVGPKPVILVLHRIVNARLTDEAAPIPEGFDLDATLSEGAPGFEDPPAIEVVLRFEPEIGPALVDARLTGLEELTEEADGTWLLTASVPDTSQLRAWVLSYGTFVEVLEPPTLREWVAEQAVEMSERYL